jgi:ribonuclease J
MQVIIHRGARQIGGSIVEVRQGDTRILLDLGLPLSSPNHVASDPHPFDNDPPPLPGVFDDQDIHPSADAIFISHAHLDHAGHLPHVRPGIPVHATRGTWALLTISSTFGIAGALPENRQELVAGHPVRIGDLVITPFEVDHSSPDAVALLVEGGGQQLVYTGDLRSHGRKHWCFPNLLEQLPKGVDALLLEGTQVSQDRLPELPETEAELEPRFADLFKQTKGLALVFASGQNLDRTVSVYRAARRSGRTLVMDLYTAYIQHKLRFLSPNLPQHDWDGVRVKYWPNHQEILFEHDQDFLRSVKASHIHMTELVNHGEDFVLLARHNRFLRHFLEHFPDPTRIRFIWSMWKGYLQPNCDLVELSDFMGIKLDHCHTSGHAHVRHLQALVDAVSPKRVIPIHTEHPEGFDSLFPRVQRLADGDVLDLTSQQGVS